ncbi:Lcl C-terminal domain-containing protein [Thiolapillus sp.]
MPNNTYFSVRTSITPALTLLAGVLNPGSLCATNLTDTGQDLCYNGSGMVTCDASTTGDSAAYPAQDGRFGRDAAAAAGQLSKIGAGEAGFDYTKICNSGEPAGNGDCPANPVPGNGTNDWGCTRDNVTNLIWEVKINDVAHLRHHAWTYSWYSTDGTTNGGNTGTPDGGDNCLDATRCDTEKFLADVNAAGLCGQSDWRVPNPGELQTLANYSKASGPPIDNGYFPNAVNAFHWSASSTAIVGATYAWAGNGRSGGFPKSNQYAVRLVRGGQP